MCFISAITSAVKNGSIANIQAEIDRLKTNRIKYEFLEEKLKASGEPQISKTDEDFRGLLVRSLLNSTAFVLKAGS